MDAKDHSRHVLLVVHVRRLRDERVGQIDALDGRQKVVDVIRVTEMQTRLIISEILKVIQGCQDESCVATMQ